MQNRPQATLASKSRCSLVLSPHFVSHSLPTRQVTETRVRIRQRSLLTLIRSTPSSAPPPTPTPRARFLAPYFGFSACLLTLLFAHRRSQCIMRTRRELQAEMHGLPFVIKRDRIHFEPQVLPMLESVSGRGKPVRLLSYLSYAGDTSLPARPPGPGTTVALSSHACTAASGAASQT